MAKNVTNEDIENVYEEAEKSSSILTINLSQPIDYAGKGITALNFDFDSLTGRDLMAASREMKANGRVTLQRQFDDDFLLIISARACKEKVGTDILESLKFSELMEILDKAKLFTLKPGL